MYQQHPSRWAQRSRGGLPKGVGGGRGTQPAVVGGGRLTPKAVGAGHGGPVPRRNRLSVLLPVHSGGGRLQCPKVRRGKVGGEKHTKN